jgi:peptide/nickel transport system substrate-binding protein
MKAKFFIIGLFCFVGLIVSAIIAICQDGGKNMIYGEVGSPISLDPLTINDDISIRLVELIFDGLVGFNEKGDPVPELAEKVDVSDNEKVYAFHLRNGLKWHGSSTQVSAYDVVFTFDLIKKTPSALRDLLNFVDKVEALDANTVRITLTERVHAAQGRLSFDIVPRHMDSLKTFGKSPIGTGSFRYNGHPKENTIHLVANRNAIHHPNLDAIYQMSFDDAFVAFQALSKGEINLWPDTPIEYLPLIQVDLRKKPYNTLSIACIGYNMRKPYLQDKRVRRAFTMALNKEGLLRRLYWGYGEVIWGPYPQHSAANYKEDEINARYRGRIDGFEGIPEYSPENIDRAKQLIQDVRRDGRFTNKPLIFKVPAPSKGEITALSTLYLHYVNTLDKDLGVKVEYEPVEWLRWKEDIFVNHDFDITYIEWSFGDLMDITPLFHSKNAGPNQNNIVGYKNDRVDGLLEDSLLATPEALVTSIYPELCAIVGDDCPYTFLWSVVRYAGYHKKLKKLKIDPFNFFEFVDELDIQE